MGLPGQIGLLCEAPVNRVPGDSILPVLPGSRRGVASHNGCHGGACSRLQFSEVAAHQFLVALWYRAAFHVLPRLLRVLPQDFVIWTEPPRGNPRAGAGSHLCGDIWPLTRYEYGLSFSGESPGAFSLAVPGLVARAGSSGAATGPNTGATCYAATGPNTGAALRALASSRGPTIAATFSLPGSRWGSPRRRVPLLRRPCRQRPALRQRH